MLIHIRYPLCIVLTKLFRGFGIYGFLRIFTTFRGTFLRIFYDFCWDFKGHLKGHWDLEDFSKLSKLLTFYGLMSVIVFLDYLEISE